jgi:hypothetical protein
MTRPLTDSERAQWDESRQPLLISLITTLLAVSILSTAARLFAAFRFHGRPRLEDYLMIVAVIFSASLSAATLAVVPLGYGLHEFRMLATAASPADALATIFRNIWIYAVLNGLCFSCIKLSVLLFYRRVFWILPWFQVCWWLNVAYVLCWLVGSTLFYVLQCQPVNWYWMRAYVALGADGVTAPPGAACTEALGKIGTPIILNTIGDLFVLALPVPIVLHLRASHLKRLRTLFLFAVGTLATVSGFVRFALIFVADIQTDVTCEYSTF